MQDQQGPAEFKLDTLTRSVRFAAGIAPKAATRVSLGVVLALDDAYNNDPASELLGIKLSQGASAVASTIGSIAASVRSGIRSKAEHLNAEDGPMSKVPVLANAREFVTQAATEAKGVWTTAGYVAVQVEESEASAPADTMLASDGPSALPSTQPSTEIEGVIS